MRASDGFVSWAASLPEVRAELAESREFRIERHAAERYGYSDQRLDVDVAASPEQLALAFERTQSVWQLLGETQPHWSVLSAPQFRPDQLADARAEFDEYGRKHADELINVLSRNGLDGTNGLVALELGCGVGRTTRWIAESFEHVTGYDISRSHLDVAASELASAKVSNVELAQISTVADFDRLVRVDVVYSVIVLQHNPPVVIDVCLRQLLAALKPGGIAVIQIPTYLDSYRFSIGEYLATDSDEPDKMEMHVLPQERVFDVVAEAGCRVAEVFEDFWTNLRPKSMSNTFVIKRPS